MGRRLGTVIFVVLLAFFLLYLQNKVYVGDQEFFAYGIDGDHIIPENGDGGSFQLKDIAGNPYIPKEAQLKEFEYFVDRGLAGHPFPIDKSSIKLVDGSATDIEFKFTGEVSKRIRNQIKRRLLQFSFTEKNAERPLLYVPLGIDLRGGVEFICSLYDDDQNRVDADQQVVDILRTRLESRGLSEPQVSRLTNGDIQVVIPGGGKAEAARTRKVLETTGKLEFREVLDAYGDESDEATSSTEPGRVVHKDKRGKWAYKPGGGGRLVSGEVLYPMKAPRGENPKAFYRLGPAKITGQDVKDGFVSQDDNGGPAVGIELNATGGSKSFEWSQAIKDRGDAGQGSGRFAICLDGVVYSAPRIIEPTGARSRVTGNFTSEEVNNLVLVLDTGALTVTPEVLSERVIGATLGKETISKGLGAMVGAVAVILAFIVMYYQRLGVVAMASLATTLALVWTAVSVFSTTMTLPGLAGLVLTIGMAVDANILIFERIREELSDDIDLKTSLDAGYARAFLTIFDANVTTFLTAFVLSWIGTGAIKGFGNTLMIGIVTSMFGAIYVGRLMTDILYRNKESAKVADAMSRLPLPKSYISKRFMAAGLSAAIIVIGLSVFISGGSKHFAIDFTGGNMVQATLEEPKTLEDIQAALAQAAASDPEAFDLLGDDLQILPYFSEFAKDNNASRQYVFKGRDAKAIVINRDMAGIQQALWDKNAERAEMINAGSALTSPEVKAIDVEIKKLQVELKPFKEKLAARIEVFKGELAKALAGMIIEENSEVVAAGKEGNRLHLRLHMLGEASSQQVAQISDALNGRNDLDKVQISTDGEILSIHADYTALINADQDLKEKDVQEALASDALLKRIYDLAGGTGAQAAHLSNALLLRNFYDQCVDRAASSGLQVAAAYPATDHFSPQVAEQMKNKAYLALAFSLLAILFYIAMRFEFRYGVGAIVALAHDVLATVGILAVLGVRIDLTVIAALLTIVGYSLNDTIVVFDRIRENMQKFGKGMRDTIDGAIAQTMSRTILTSSTTIFVIVVLLIFGGEGVRSFSVTMLVGLILGTYSSIFVASPSLLLFKDAVIEEDETDEVVAGT